MDALQQFVYQRTYARYLEGEGRRETWPETVDRLCNYLFSKASCQAPLPEKVQRKIKQAILNLDVLPSMRLLWSAGDACDATNMASYNCSALAITDQLSWGEILLNLMAGAGVGFSVQSHHINQLPVVKLQANKPVSQMVIPDSRWGWQEALNAGISLWYEGRDIVYDYSQIRPLGAPLRTMGGRASGPEVLRSLLEVARQTFMAAQGRRLTALECHDLACHVARCVIAGGVRRSATISLSDLTDREMRYAKKPPFDPVRHGANNSAVYVTKPDDLEFLHEWQALGRSKTGERGIYNLGAARVTAPHRRKSKLLELTNPCGEVTLRDHGVCNLTTFRVTAEDTFETLREKVITASWLGVLQSLLTDFPGLRPEWRANAEEERLCGVSPTGILDNPGLLQGSSWQLLKEVAVSTGRKASKAMGVNMPAAMTCVKPSGTVSELVGSSSGIHPRWAPYYLRSIQIAKTDPLYWMLQDQGAPFNQSAGDDVNAIIEFPVKSPEGAITRQDMSAIDQLEVYKQITSSYCEMNCSTTVYVDDNEWITVAAWVHDNWDSINGVAFFPKKGNGYDWSPLKELTQEEYEQRLLKFPTIDFNKLPDYEKADSTTGAREYACSGDKCLL